MEVAKQNISQLFYDQNVKQLQYPVMQSDFKILAILSVKYYIIYVIRAISKRM